MEEDLEEEFVLGGAFGVRCIGAAPEPSSREDPRPTREVTPGSVVGDVFPLGASLGRPSSLLRAEAYDDPLGVGSDVVVAGQGGSATAVCMGKGESEASVGKARADSEGEEGRCRAGPVG